MSDSLWKISGGCVYDPLHGVDGEVRDLWIEGGKIVAPPTDPGVRPARTLDASGLVIMPGGVDMHCHIAGPKVNMARKMRPEDRRLAPVVRRTGTTHSGTTGSVPSTLVTGYKYAGLGYTAAFDAAVPPLSARHAHEEFEDTPCIDKGIYVLMGNNHYILQALHDNRPDSVRSFVAWLLGATKGYAVKLVNPGGVEVWKHHAAGNVNGIDQLIDAFDVTPRQIIRGLAAAVDELRLPHSVHIHCNNLGLPGNWSTTLETLKALEGHRGHLTHVQFHSYGGGNEDETTFCSKVVPLAEYVNAHENITVDVGQVLFGETTSMTGDGPLGYYLHKVYGTKWFSVDTEMESGCGIVPIVYRDKSLIHSIQWAIGLEWFLLMQDPWRVVMSTDHPNGASFMLYPRIIRMLMDRTYRQDALKSTHPALRQRSTLMDLDREYTLRDICIITRAGPAKILGLKNKGHLAPGADADITIYTPHDDKEVMFQLPRYVIKNGQLLVEDCELRETCSGKTLHVAPEYDPACEVDIAEWFEKYYSVRFRNYPVSDTYLQESEVVECG